MNQETTNPVPPEMVPQVPKPAAKQLFKDFFDKIRQNKKIFWLIVSLFSIIVVITIAGIIFRLIKGQKDASFVPSPTTKVAVVEQKEEEPLDLAKQELESIEARIKDFDIYQKRLSPPAVNFDIEF